MINKDNAAVLLGMAAIVVTLALGTCSTNGRIDDVNRRMDDGFNNLQRRMDDGFNSLQRQIDDTNQRMDDGFNSLQRQIDDTNQRMDDGFNSLQRQIDDTNRRIEDVQEDVRELRTMLFETLKGQAPAD